MPRTDAEKEARKRYDKKCRRLVVTVYPTESDILRRVESVGEYSAYIKGLIRADIERGDDGR